MLSTVSRLFKRALCANRSAEEVLTLLISVRERTISDEEWDDFISVKICDIGLEKIRIDMEEIWTEDSPYMVTGSMNPRDLNPKGVAEIQKLIHATEIQIQSRQIGDGGK